jgi:protein SMG6
MILQARRDYLRNMQHAGPVPRASRNAASASGPSLKLVPGYTVLVVDTNILLSHLAQFAALVEAHQWTVVVPLPVVMELDGLANDGALGTAAAAAAGYVSAALRTHAVSLKVLTSRGNYLRSLAVRAEQVAFGEGEGPERSMDDLILRAAVWQDEHWADRSAILGAESTDTAGAQKVVLLTKDRNRKHPFHEPGFSALIPSSCSAHEGTCEAACSGQRVRHARGAGYRHVMRAWWGAPGAPRMTLCARTGA